MLTYDYDYDLLHQPFISRPIDKNCSVTIRLKQVKKLFGFVVKLNRYGNPSALKYEVRCGSQLEKGELLNSVWPVFEHFCYCAIGIINADYEEITIRIYTEEGELPLDGYRIFGPAQGGEEFDEAEKPPYWWFDTEMATPKYYRPAKYKPCDFADTIYDDGSIGPAMSIRVYESEDECKQGSDDTFNFLSADFADKYSEWSYIKPTESLGDETVVGKDWDIDWCVTEKSKFFVNLSEEAAVFFLKCFNVCNTKSSGKGCIKFVEESVDVKGRDGHIIDVSDNEIIVRANSLDGLRSALTYIEDTMLSNQRPAIKRGIHKRSGLYDIRISSAMIPAPYNYMVLQSGTMLCDSYLWRYSRSGYNALWFLVNMEELANLSNVFPEMHCDESETAIERLKRLTELAIDYGLDVYVQLATGYFRSFPESVYKRIPSMRSFKKWGDYPCSGHDDFKAFMHDTVTGMFENTSLKGVIVIYDTEGFYNCFANNKQSGCPNCKDRSADELASDFFTELKQSVRSIRNDGEVIAWSYYCDDDWNYRLLESLDADINLMSCFSQFVHFERFGVEARTDDYAVCVTGPGKYFKNIEALARRTNKPLLAKTEVSSGQEFVSLPYLPVLHLHQKRWDEMAKYSLQGFMGDYIHTHFRNSPCIVLMRLNCYITKMDGNIAFSSTDKVSFAARLYYGEFADRVEKAWALFSKAFEEYFPYSAGVCRYPGPLQSGATQPFYLDKNRPIMRKSARCNSKDLAWTKLYFPKEMTVGKAVDNEWNDNLLKKCFTSFSELILQGINILEGIEDHRVIKLKNIARAMNSMVQSMINFIDFIYLRDNAERDCSWEKEITDLLNRELDNTEMAIQLCKVDSELGFSAEGQGTVRGGLYNVYALELKRSELTQEIESLKDKQE